jgi:hypothetical protein
LSHLVGIQTQLRDATAIAAACQRLSLAEPVLGKAQFYDGQTAEGLLVQLPGWRYPLAINTQTGEVQHDNFGGHWGDQEQLDRFLQAYVIEEVRLQSRKQGYPVIETLLQDGSVMLEVQEGS